MKTESQRTLSKRLREAIYKDLEDAYNEAAYDTYDFHGTLDTLQELGVGAMPHTEVVLKELEEKENNSYKRLLNTWGM